jgi:Tol biopolymer transport system component
MLYQTGSEKSPGIGLWDAKGINVRDLGRPGEHYSPAFSPDGQHLVVGWRESDHSANQDLWTYDLGRSAWVRTTTDPEWDGSPIWSPDGREMAYSSLRGGVPAIYVQSPLTASPPRRITQDKLSRHPTDWSPDGKFLLVTDESNVASSGPDQALLPLDGSASIRINPTPFSERHGRFLPTDGTWIAYTSNESGRDQVYVQSTVRPTKIQISNNGGSQPRFRHDGRELYYLAPTNEIMAVSISSGPVIRASEPRILFRAPGTRTLSFGNSYDVSRDGRQFVFSYVPPDEAPNDFNVVLNWRPR